MEVILSNKSGWHVNDALSVRGYCFDATGKYYSGKDLLSYFDGVADESSFISRLREANGLFAVIVHTPQFEAVAVDRLRTVPLFYTVTGEVSDNPDMLSFSSSLDSLAVDFYLASGAVLPGQTLLNDVQQVVSGNFVVWKDRQWKSIPYCNYLCEKGGEITVTLPELQKTMESVFGRLVESAGGRQLVVPLSAGNDSRLILCQLHRLGYKNVVCYTVTGPDDEEWRVAHETAVHLGYPHYRISPQDDEVRTLCGIGGPRFEQYYKYVGCYTNFVWLFEYAAICVLKSKGVIASDAIFVPGHSGDSIAGSHITKAHVTPRDNARSLTRKMAHVSFEYGSNNTVLRFLNNYFEQMLSAGISSFSAYQNWIVQHRQAHNIVNSIRAYTFFGYEVRLPLWDNALYDTFAQLPYEALYACRLYTQYVNKIFQQYGIPLSEPKKTMASWKVRLKILFGVLKKRYSRLKGISPTDRLGEWVLAQPLYNELVAKKGEKAVKSLSQTNDLIMSWYLMKVQEFLSLFQTKANQNHHL